MSFPQSVLALVGNDGNRVRPFAPPSQQSGNLNLIGAGSVTITATGPNTMTVTGTGSGGGVVTLTGNTGGPITATAGNINIVGSGSTTVAGSGSTLTISSSASVIPYTNVSANTALAINNGYIATSGSLLFTLPATAPIGSVIALAINGATGWTINLSGGQTIVAMGSGSVTTYATSASMVGAGPAPNVGVFVGLVCVTANTKWYVTSVIGQLGGS